MTTLTHFNESGHAQMVDVGAKPVTHRVAVAGGLIRMLPETHAMVCAGTHKKGDVLGISRVAGIMAAKKTSELIPLWLTGVQVALATIYDMCKAVDRAMVISEVRLLEKKGGKSGHFVAEDSVE